MEPKLLNILIHTRLHGIGMWVQEVRETVESWLPHYHVMGQGQSPCAFERGHLNHRCHRCLDD